MDPNTIIKFSRDGVEIGEYKLWHVEYQLKLGVIKSTDHYWHEGMTQWEPITKLLEIIEKIKKDEQIAKAKKDEEVARAKKEEQRNSNFKCNCCRHIFEEPKTFLGGSGCAILLLFMIAGLTTLFAAKLFFEIGLVLIILCLIICITLHSIKQPGCPKCGSSNFAKPEKPSK